MLETEKGWRGRTVAAVGGTHKSLTFLDCISWTKLLGEEVDPKVSVPMPNRARTVARMPRGNFKEQVFPFARIRHQQATPTPAVSISFTA